MRKLAVLFTLLFAFPTFVSAQVVISEIMYDFPGTEGSGEHDWIEVFNAGPSAVDLSTYRFVEAGVNHTLKLDRGATSIAVGGHAIIANSPGTFIADYPSFDGTLFDSSFNLSGSGEAIGMRTGDLVDTDPLFTYVPQDAASNNGSSLHRGAISGSAFSAAAPSPGSGTLVAQAGNSTSNSATTTTASTTSTTQSSSLSTIPSYIPPPVPKLFADAGQDRTVIVGADTEFRARAYNRDQEIVDTVRFSWNFGDGTRSDGPTVLHHFNYPGRYSVMLYISESIDTATDQVVVTAEPARLGFIVHSDGSVAIENFSAHDLDLSGWIIRSFGRDFVLPPHSILLEEETLRISYQTLTFSVDAKTVLAYPNGEVALRAGEKSFTEEARREQPVATQVSQPQRIVSAPRITIQSAYAEEIEENAEASVATSSPYVAAAAASADISQIRGGYLWWLGALGIAFLIAGVVVAVRHMQRREWQIIEES